MPKARSTAHPCLQLPGEVLLPVPVGLLAARVARALLPKSSQGELSLSKGSRLLGALGSGGRKGQDEGINTAFCPARRTSHASCSALRSTWCTSPARTSSSESSTSVF